MEVILELKIQMGELHQQVAVQAVLVKRKDAELRQKDIEIAETKQQMGLLEARIEALEEA
jgi:hypothetical protein